ncbi:unnamed protein product [Penicillium salamii]|uniref:aromatic-amino-acid transaminase n=1 Tax=Penicillium salamii TaxID=1612424 RepID=A0A9W4NN39_9EURO|nr:unnamed protein product [Penicillium salamii]CAG8362961.1 unnamed protein product [Penicillium salamii]CAG8369870.1 unnamed protein product [Penicillium salamii]CAG8390153.1 unnamed protein product [Penicillium salamii]
MPSLAAFPNDTELAEKRRLLNGIQERREKAGKLVAGVAAGCDVDQFKAPTSDKPNAKRWDSHISPESQSRPPCILKQAASHLSNPDIVSLGGGLPSSECFPFYEWSFKVPTAQHFFKDQDELEDPTVQTVTIGKHDVKAGLSEYDLSIALNYGQASGSPQIMRFITEHTELVYNPPYADWKVAPTVGSTGALEQTIRLLFDRSRGDSVLAEEYSFSTALETFVPQGIKPFGVKMDDEGLIPESMDAMLTSWDEKSRGARKPHVLYTIPSGQNPTGATQSLQRRRAIYSVCQKHDIFIIEDEPYYFIQMPPYQGNESDSVQASEDVESFLAGLVPSYLSLDIDGRVLRMDSFSKVLVPGSRLGWVTASAQIIERFLRHAEVANQGPNGMSQIMLWKLLDQTWGHEGYLKWLIALKNAYTQKRNMLLAACDKFLPKSVVSWTPPTTGMFLWLKCDPLQHPEYPARPIEEIEGEIFDQAIKTGVLCARGTWFRAEPDTPADGMFFRATYASATAEAMGTAIERFGEAIRRSYQIE